MNGHVSFQIRLFIPFLPHHKTLLLRFISPFFWLLKLLCNLITCRSFFTSLSGSISSSVNRLFATALLTCLFYFSLSPQNSSDEISQYIHMILCHVLSSHHHNCSRNWVLILPLHDSIRQEHRWLEKEKKSSVRLELNALNDLRIRLRQGIENCKRVTVVSEKEIITYQVIRSWYSSQKDDPMKHKKKEFNYRERKRHVITWSETGVLLHLMIELQR